MTEQIDDFSSAFLDRFGTIFWSNRPLPGVEERTAVVRRRLIASAVPPCENGGFLSLLSIPKIHLFLLLRFSRFLSMVHRRNDLC